MSTFVTLLFLAFSTIHYVSGSQYNVLCILIDDFRPLTDQNVTLPNIQKLAANGTSFVNAFAQQALCGPSRNSLLTGRRPDALRLYDVNSYWRKTHDVGNYTTLPQYFKENGYVTHSLGKVFHPGKCSNHVDDYPYSWTYKPFHPPTDKYRDAAVCKNPGSKRLRKNIVCPVEINDMPGKSLPDIQTLNHAIQLLKELKSRNTPYFVAVGLHKPHIPLKFPKEYLERIPLYTVSPPHHPKIPKELPKVAYNPWVDLRKRDDISRLDIPFPMGIMPTDWALKIKQSYFAAATYIDDLIGVLLNHIDLNNTIVLLTSDHGWSLGENGLWGKYTNYDASLKVPLIFAGPTIPRSKSISRTVELIDIFPTLAELAGLPTNIPRCNTDDRSTLCFEGESLYPLMSRPNYKKQLTKYNKMFALSQYPRPSIYPRINTDQPKLRDIKIMGYSIRTNKYRYTEWIPFNNIHFTRNWTVSYGIELYDHTKDPHESENVYKNKKYKDIRTYFAKLLRSRVDPERLWSNITSILQAINN